MTDCINAVKNDVTLHSKELQFLMGGLQNLRAALSKTSIETFVVNTIETLMTIERDEYLSDLNLTSNYDKSNGSYKRVFKSLFRQALVVNVPRTRSGAFQPKTIELIKLHQESVNELALALYRKGMTTRDIEELLLLFFGEKLSFSQISKLAESFNEVRSQWENINLESTYKVIYCDGIYITVKRGDSYSKEPVHVIYGVREDNRREVLHVSVNPSESAVSWAECFNRLKARGVSKVGLVVADGLEFLEEEVHKHFPGAQFQKCVVHKIRNIMGKSRPKDKKEIGNDMKLVFDNFENDSSIEKGKQKLEVFLNKWMKMYPSFKGSFGESKTEYLFTYIKFPCNVRRLIYTTNSIENLNRVVRKATKNKLSFEKPERLLDYVYIVVKDFEASNWMRYPVSTFKFWPT